MMNGRVRRCVVAWLALMGLLALTVSLTFVPLGPWRLAASLAIAAVKATLVAWTFMELGGAPRTVRLVVALTGGLLLVLIGFSSLDAAVRGAGA